MADYQNQKVARKLYRGETWVGEFTPPTTVDVSGWTFKAYLYTDPKTDDAAPVLTLDPVTMNGSTGVVQVRMTADETLSVAAGDYILDLWREEPDESSVERLAGVSLAVATGGRR